MRIIAGSLRRRTIRVPQGAEVRPTTDRVREAMFNWLAARLDFEGAQVLDLFAGSGAIGLEAVSRGAASCTFVEQNRKVAETIRENATALGVVDRCRIHTADALAWCRRSNDSFDLIAADPPYVYDDQQELLETAAELLSPGGILMLEHGRRSPEVPADQLLDRRTYGSTVVTYLAAPSPAS
ncbi:MAG: 16S rRNA (guanine(966)-N(2))-methyltransferase RsmD [Rhodothermales bacterium]|nr:16S rRNA (guanine(966)-N(2))-methyltransferase RsmD [Rhodothermales bacterium]MBO6780393.1 16S rRNA (guanine(966)-N(2))-methyltransferase RsmD [Rhodothermales bacterium]